MIIYFIETTNSTPHLEISLELALLHLKEGHEVHYYFIGHAVDHTEFLVKKSSTFFKKCLPEEKGFSLIDSPNFHYYTPEPGDLRLSISLPKFKNVSELKNYRYKKYNAGLSSLSSLVSATKDSNPNLETYDQELIKIISSGISVYEFSRKILKKRKPDLLYLFNGRFANNRAILDAAKELGVDFLIHERGSDKSRYSTRSYMPHNFLKIQKDMLAAWNTSNRPTSSKIANKFFEKRRMGEEQGWKSFIRNQKKGLVLNCFRPDQKLITYFSSSDDEYVAVGDIVKWERWPDQLTAIKDLISIVGKHSSLALAIRIHPHMAEKSPNDLRDWLELELPDNVRLIRPSDEIDSYAQIEKSDLVITSGSTIGIESVYLDTPSVCLGPSLYSQLDAVYLPKSNSELEALLLSDSLDADPENALPYGYYMATFGEKFVYYEPETLFSGKFMGINLQAFGACKVLKKVKSTFYKIRLMVMNLFTTRRSKLHE